MIITDNNDYITTSSLIQYQTKKIKRTFDTKIREFSSEGDYDYLAGPQLTVVSPVEGQLAWAGDIIDIEWNSEEVSLMPKVDIYILDNNTTIAAYRVDNFTSSSFKWEIPENTHFSEKMKILVTGSFDDVSFSDYSPGYFTIDKRYIRFDFDSSDVTKIVANVGNTYPLSWISHGVGRKIKVELLNYTGDPPLTDHNLPVLKTLETVYEITTEENIYNWIANDINRGIDKVRIKISDVEFPKIYGISGIIDILIPYIEHISIGTLYTFSPRIKINSVENISSYNPYVHITDLQIV